MSLILDRNGALTRASTRVAVCVLAGATVPTTGAYSLAGMLAHSGVRRDLEIRLYVDRNPNRAQARHDAVLFAIDTECTHIFFLDPELLVPKDTLLRLLALEQPFTAASYVSADMPPVPSAIGADGPIYEAETAIVEAEHVGLGAALVEVELIRSLPLPWFQIGFNPKTGRYVDEELYFTRSVREQGHPVLVDLALSREVVHLGEMEYRSEHALQTRDLAGRDGASVSGDR